MPKISKPFKATGGGGGVEASKNAKKYYALNQYIFLWRILLSVTILFFFINEVNQFFRNWLCNIEVNEIDA